MRATLEILGMIAVLFVGVFIYDRYFVDHEQPKPIITRDSTYYWISASQLDTLKELRSRVDSFTVVGRRRSVTILPKAIPTGSVVDTPKIASSTAVSIDTYDCDTVFVRGMDSNRVSVSFTAPNFRFVSKFNDDHVLVKDRVTTVVLPPKKKFITHGISIGPMIGILNKKVDIGIGYTFTFNF